MLFERNCIVLGVESRTYDIEGNTGTYHKFYLGDPLPSDEGKGLKVDSYKADKKLNLTKPPCQPNPNLWRKGIFRFDSFGQNKQLVLVDLVDIEQPKQ